MTIGKLLKQFRIENAKTQKEWASGIVSPSYYSKVEKDKHRISADDLLAILRANKVDLWQFFSRLNQADEMQQSETDALSHLVNQAYYKNDPEMLKEIRQVVENNDFNDKENILLYIDATIAKAQNDLKNFSKEKSAKLKELFFNTIEFDEMKLRLYINVMSIYDLDANIMIGQKIIAKLGTSTNIHHQEELLSMIGNILIDCVEQERYEDTAFFTKAADKIVTSPLLFFYKNMIVILENMINYHFDHQDIYLKNAKWGIKNFSFLGMPEYGSELTKFFNEYCEQRR